MSDFLRLYRDRVDRALRPHRDIYGEDSPVVRMGLRLLAEAEDVERALEVERVSTPEAARRTGWAEDTLQKYARAVLEGEPVPAEWAGLIVSRRGRGYEYVLGSIPEHPASAAA